MTQRPQSRSGRPAQPARPASALHQGRPDDVLERPLQHSREAELTVLGAIVLDERVPNVALITATQIVRADDFFSPQHRYIFDCMVKLAQKEMPIGAITLTEQLGKLGKLQDLEGGAYLSQLGDGMPRVNDVAHYARIVRDKALLRRVIFSTEAIREQALAGSDDAAAVLDRAEAELAKIRELARSTTWQTEFHTVDELPDGDTIFLIDRFLPEGLTFLGALSGVGKTWFSLSMARALTTGEKFLGTWSVPAPVNVIYLCPEMSAKTFKKRCKRFGIRERFRCQTIADGAPLDLAAPHLLAAIRELQPVVFLDTAIRFSSAEDENSAAENQQLTRAIFSLIYAGARAVVCLHHRAKDTARADEMTLENTLRGTSDMGAVAAAVYGLRYDSLSGGNAPYLKESRRLVRLQVRCVKARDFVPVDDFRAQLEPFIDEIGDMAALVDEQEQQESEGERLSKAIAANPKATKIELQAATKIGRNRIGKLAAAEGWHYEPMKGWEQT